MASQAVERGEGEGHGCAKTAVPPGLCASSRRQGRDWCPAVERQKTDLRDHGVARPWANSV